MNFLKLPQLLIRAILRKVLFFIDSSPKLRKYVVGVVHKLGLYSTARVFYEFLADLKYRTSSRNSKGFIPSDIKHLPPHALQVYEEINAALSNGKRGR